MTDSERLQKGQEILQKLRGGASGTGSATATEEVFPEFWKMTQEHLFGEVWSRPGLALRDRSMISMTTLTVLGRMEELKMHMGYALNLGIPREEILEMLMHVAHYAGWPAAVSALRVAKEVFASRG
ncbi:MAG: carboxymuconolactone decarboxylase family protein [Dehalococcoidia bacterium]|nr:carboxymuconolactone decarboxylase family protein [Dehalococcoidia bacterium]